jgi:transcriptional regulator with XRE-family HTH domain
MSSDAQARAAARAEAMLLEMQLQDIRKSRNVTQVELAQVLNVEQAAISKLENREDMYVSTLREYIRALGGELQLVAKFPDAEIKVHSFEPVH